MHLGSLQPSSSSRSYCSYIVLSNLAKKTSQYDLEEEDGADVGKVIIGRDASLFWSSKRAQKFGTHAGAKVSMDLYGNIRMLVGSSCRNQSAKFCYFSVVKTCNEAWNVTQESEDSEETNFPDLLLYEKEGNCIESGSPHFATPENYQHQKIIFRCCKGL